MTACICVDYLAHDWDVNDIIQAHHEIKKQRLQGKRKQQDSSKAYQVEQDKLIRYENAVWRQMAKICTHQLGRSNRQINPSAVNWQKESDITWLYGPLYTTTPSLTFPPTPPLKGIKSVLKKQPISLPPYRPWSKTCSEPGTSTVRFNPDIQELEYLPESPIVRKSPHTYYWPEDDEDDEDDDALISMLVDLFHFTTKKSTQWISSYFRPNRSERDPPIFLIFLSMTKSLTSLLATWVMYQSLLPFTWLINHSKKNHHHTTF